MSAAVTNAVTPGLTVGVPASTSENDLPATLASLQTSAARFGPSFEIVVAVNGPDEPAAAVGGVETFARQHGLPLIGPDDAAETLPVVRLLRLAPRSKVAAWNSIRAIARAPVIVFADADVRVAVDAIPLLLARLVTSPELAIVAGREAAMVLPQDGLAARVAALPHRFDFGNVPGRLYALRAAALPDPLPATVLHEDAYLSVLLGRKRFAKEQAAIVYLRPPTTWSDYLRQRVRNEVGKLQLTREFPELHRAHGFGRYPWRRFIREIAPREYPLVALSMVARVYARFRALRQIKNGFRGGWAVLPSTKHWPTADAASSGAPGGSTGA
jgi:cellulose synthase/poly-beta-1,6-N-acetylglucosamine synthase-like glycosyltransferase